MKVHLGNPLLPCSSSDIPSYLNPYLNPGKCSGNSFETLKAITEQGVAGNVLPDVSGEEGINGNL